jgi:hypothetical protein
MSVAKIANSVWLMTFVETLVRRKILIFRIEQKGYGVKFEDGLKAASVFGY